MPPDDQRLTVAITGLNANDNPGSGIGVARALKAHYGGNIRIIGLAYEALEPGIYMAGVIDQVYQVPYPAAGTQALFERLETIHQKEKLDVVIPNYDAELYNFIRIAPGLEQAGIKTFLPDMEQLNARDKSNLAEFGRQHGLNVPKSFNINKPEDMLGATQELGFPCVIKGRYYEACVVHNSEAAIKALHQLSAKWGVPVIAQEFVSGTELNVAGLGDGTGELVSAIPMRKLYITDKGKAWAGVTVEDAELIDLAAKFTQAAKWKGGFELEIIRDQAGKLYILEINPRFPAWIFLTASAGQNQPAALVKMAMGETIEPFKDYQPGKMFVRYSWDQVIDISAFQQFSAFGELPAST